MSRQWPEPREPANWEMEAVLVDSRSFHNLIIVFIKAGTIS